MMGTMLVAPGRRHDGNNAGGTKGNSIHVKERHGTIKWMIKRRY